MHKYQAPVQGSEKALEGDQRSPSRRLFDSIFAKFLRVFSVLLGVYAPIGMLFGVMLIMAPIGRNSIDEAEFETVRRVFGFAALGVIASGFIAAYGSYRVWFIAANVRRNIRRRAIGLD